MNVSAVSKPTVLASALFALLLAAGCNRAPAPAPSDASEGATAPTTAPEADPPSQATPAGFDLAAVPISTATLGAFPYLGLPDGYRADRPSTTPFERVPFWTGDRLEWVEGRVYGTRVKAEDGHPFSQLELNRNLQALVESLGGRAVFSGRIPPAGLEDIQKSSVAVERVDALGDIYNEAADVYVIRQADRTIWLQLAKSGNEAGLLIAETKPVEITAKALPADALKQSLDADGKVAIQVQFETDQATLLASSKPQLEQVIALLNDTPDLRLSINGHTDNTGNAAHNLSLSQRRAAAVRDFIVAAGIDKKRLESSGFGDTQPVADNNSEAGKARNRRVELVKL